jgi:alpha-galactosidase
MTNIALIGAGSTAFSIELLKDIAMLPSLNGSVLSLVDIDEKRLETAESLATKYCRESRMDLRIKSFTDRREALAGAEYVICAVKIGGYTALEKERTIAEEAGYYRGIGDRVSCYYGGIGAYHQIRFLQHLTADMTELCPDAWLVQTANPVFEGTNWVTRNTKIRSVGLCHGHNAYKEIAEELGLDLEKVGAEVVGFNHCVWMTSFTFEGVNAYPLIDSWIRERSEDYWRSERYNDPNRVFLKDQLSRAAVETYRLYGIMPIGDTLRSATPWWMHTDYETKCRWFGKNGGFDSKIGWDSYLDSKIEIQKNLGELVASGRPVMEAYRPSNTTEQHIPFIDALANGNRRILTLNVPNNGSIEGLPEDILVEIPVVCDANGIHNVRVGRLPDKLMDMVILPRLVRARTIINAYERRDREMLVLMLCDDPRTKSYEQAKTLIDELLSLPWNASAAEHYR